MKRKRNSALRERGRLRPQLGARAPVVPQPRERDRAMKRKRNSDKSNEERDEGRESERSETTGLGSAIFAAMRKRG